MRQRAVGLAGLLLVTVALALVISVAQLPLLGRDFYIYWSAARAVQTGHSPYDLVFLQATQQAVGWNVAREPIPFQPYLYPPWLALLLWPLGWLPFRLASLLWLAAGGVTAAATVIVAMKATGRRVRGLALLGGLLLGLTYLPVLHMLAVGQVTVWLGLLIALMAWALSGKRDTLAALCVGLLSIKPQIGLIVAALVGLGWLTQRHWRPLIWLTGTWLACALLGFSVAPNWPGEMLTVPQQFEALTNNPALANRADGPTLLAALSVNIPSSQGLRVLVGLGLGVLAIWLVYRGRQIVRSKSKPTVMWLSALGCTTVFLVTPYVRVYDLSVLIWPLMYLLYSPQIRWARWLRAAGAVVIYSWPLVLVVLGADGVWNVLAVLALDLMLILAEALPVEYSA